VLGPPSNPRGSNHSHLNSSSNSQQPASSIFDSIVQRAASAQDDEDGQPAPTSSDPSNAVLITLYRNGFTVNNGPLRDPALPENQQFLFLLQNGRIPPELLAGRNPSEQSALDVSLSDKRGEDFVPPPYVAFSGPRVTLGGGAGASTASSAFSASALLSAAAENGPVEDSEPTIVVQVRTHDNKRLKLK
jgi:UBX domain-containing protein 1